MTTPGPDAGKTEWRAWARQQRDRVDWPVVSAGIVEALRAWGRLDGRSRVLLYDPLDDEADLTPIVATVTALISRTDGDELTVHPYDAAREAHPLGFSQPVAGSQVVDPTSVDIALVPGLAFDTSGTRLGRGGGHYDRLLGGLRPEALVIGVTPAALVVESLPREGHDVRMTHLATEAVVTAVGAGPAVVEAAIEWIVGDPDPATRAALQAVVDAGDHAALVQLMGEPLRFGTAGIRGEVGPGPARMNRATVIRATRGIVDYLEGHARLGPPVVVGFDARPDSRAFAEDTVGVLVAAGVPVHAFTEPTPTPLVAHCALRLGATMAVVVTASHNPPADNGYKVYDDNGAQIVPPVDADIATAIDRVGPAATVPRIEGALDGAEGMVTRLGGEAAEAYLTDLLAFRGDPPPMRSLSIVFTPLHGVSGRFAVDALARAGHSDVAVVAEQFDPDGSFPTVAFPNPEEPGALDLAERLATERSAELVIANDPDGDRLAMSVPGGDGWRRLTGNEVGVLLGDFVFERTAHIPDRLAVSSIVSSPMLADVAAAHGVRYEATLTGFKWICNAALDLEAAGHRFVYGYEEALGYAVGTAVRDKDGISAAVWFADLAGVCAEAGETVLDRLARLYAEHGVWVSVPRNLTRQGPNGIEELTAGLDRLASSPPGRLGDRTVTGVTDYRTGADLRPRWLHDTPLVALHLEGGSRVLARPSGTEPKLKIYADVRRDAGSLDAVAAVEADAREEANTLADEVAQLIESR